MELSDRERILLDEMELMSRRLAEAFTVVNNEIREYEERLCAVSAHVSGSIDIEIVKNAPPHILYWEFHKPEKEHRLLIRPSVGGVPKIPLRDAPLYVRRAAVPHIATLIEDLHQRMTLKYNRIYA